MDAIKINAALTKYALEIPANAMINPPVACPAMDEIKQEDELSDIAFCKFVRGTIAAIMLLAAGDEKDLIMPVKNTVMKMTVNFVVTVNCN